ncbi:MAG: hypothetical protein U0800_21515 [Isosphaeraceae bacterium]
MASIEVEAPNPPVAGGFRLKHLLVATAGIAVLMAVESQPGWIAWVLQVPAALAIGTAFSFSWPSRDPIGRSAVRFFALSGLLILTLVAQRLSHPGIQGALMALMTALLTASVVCITFASWLTQANARDRSRRPGWIAAMAAIVGIFLPFVLALSPWLMDAGFAISRPGLETLADRVADGKPVRWPQRIGVFTVHDAVIDRSSGNIGLILDPNPNGRTGLLRRPPGGVANGPFFNLNVSRDLGRCWLWQEED